MADDVSNQVSGDRVCRCGHYAAWHGGMGLGVPTFCKECRCKAFFPRRVGLLAAVLGLFFGACGGVQLGSPSLDGGALETADVGPSDAHRPALEDAYSDVGAVGDVDMPPEGSADTSTSCVAVSYRAICMNYPATGSSCLIDCRSPFGGSVTGSNCSILDVPGASWCVTDCGACP